MVQDYLAQQVELQNQRLAQAQAAAGAPSSVWLRQPIPTPCAPRLDSEFHMEAEVPPVSARNQRRRSQKIWGGAEVRQSAGMGPENRWSPANTRLAQANKREAWHTWQSKSHHVSSRIVDSSIAQRFFVFGPEPVMTPSLIEAH